MVGRQYAAHDKGRYVGKILVAVGFAGLIADLAFLAQPLERLVQRLGEGFFSIVAALGLSFLNAARAIALHQIDYFSLVSRILVLFLALVAVVTGTVLWNSRRSAIDTGERLSHSAAVRGDR
jgi:uncharacterized iron-regulated membrane protein